MPVAPPPEVVTDKDVSKQHQGSWEVEGTESPQMIITTLDSNNNGEIDIIEISDDSNLD